MAQPKWEQLQALRRELHQHPEVGFKERETQERMRTALLSAGLEPEAIRVCQACVSVSVSGVIYRGPPLALLSCCVWQECAQTGLVADIRGTGESEARSSVTMVGALHSPSPSASASASCAQSFPFCVHVHSILSAPAPPNQRKVALRTDLDALPMTESNAHLPYRSAKCHSPAPLRPLRQSSLSALSLLFLCSLLI